MLINKKKLWILAAIPLYAACRYLSVLFAYEEYRINDILCLCAFVLSAVAITVCKKKVFIVVCSLITHLGLIGASFFLSDNYGFTVYEWFAYGLFSLPALWVIALVRYLKSKSFVKKHSDEKVKNQSKKLFIFEVFCFLPFMIAMIYFILKRESISFKFDSTAVYLLTLLVFQIVLLIVNHFNNYFIQTHFKKLIVLTIAISVCESVVYSFFAYRFVQDKVYLAFPVITVLILICDEYTVAKSQQA